MADLIKRTDTLNQGREKLNTAITDAETAKIVSEQADDKATQALAKSESTQTQLDTIVIDGDSSVEAAQARVSTTGTAYGTLKQRLDTEYEEVTSQLAQRPTQEEVNLLVGSISDGTPLFANDTSEMTDTSRLYVNLNDGYIYIYYESAWISTGKLYQSTGIADKSIRLSHTQFRPINNGTLSKNIFDKSSVTIGKFVSDTTGNLGNNSEYAASDFIPANENTTYVLRYKSLNFSAFYDQNKNYLGGYKGASADPPYFTTPVGTKFIRISTKISELDTQQLELGNVFTGYEPYGFLVSEDNLESDLKNTITGIKENHLGYVRGIKSRNLFNKEDVIHEKYVSWDTGNLGNNENYVASNFINVDPNEDYTISHFDQIAFYDIDKNYISGVNGYQEGIRTFTTPNGARFIRVSVHKPKLSIYQLEKGVQATDYVEYGTKISEELLPRSLVATKTLHSIVKSLVNSSNHVQIKLLGDSITHGVGGTNFAQDGQEIIPGWKVNTSGYCWANLLRDYFQEKFNCTVKNYGMSGSHTQHLLTNIASLIENDDDIIICMIGTNDRNNGTKDKTLFLNNLLSIANFIHGLGKEIIFMSSIPAGVANETSGDKTFHMEDVDTMIMAASNEIKQEYISLYKRLLNYCDLKGVSVDSLLDDGLHPNDEGYKVMFNIICDELGIGRKRDGATW